MGSDPFLGSMNKAQTHAITDSASDGSNGIRGSKEQGVELARFAV